LLFEEQSISPSLGHTYYMTVSLEQNSTRTFLRPAEADLKLKHILKTLPREIFQKNPRKAWQQVIFSVAMVSLGIAAIAVSPWYLLPLAWAFTGTAVTGFFVIGHDCAHRSFSNNRLVNDTVGHLAMLPLIYPFHGWRIFHNFHHKHTNKLDVDNAWQPWQKQEYINCPQWLQVIYQGMRGSFWWLASIAHWAVLHFDWNRTTGKQREQMRYSALFAIIGGAIGLTALGLTTGWWGIVKFWLMPWLGYHFWMSTFTIVHHTASDIPFTPTDEWQEAIAQLTGTVHCDYPKWVEVLCHDINVHVPHHISTAIPAYNLREAHRIIKENWGEYVKERQFNWELMKDVVGECHLYDAEKNYESFRSFYSAN
jgi:acyl-lipid omega-6 desaturase (Delta-12 desaturase)